MGTDSSSDLSDNANERDEDSGDAPYAPVDTDSFLDWIGSSGIGSFG